MNRISFDDFIKIVDREYLDYSFEYRYGQTLMNILRIVWLEKYSSLTNTEYDCFYNDGIVTKTLERLKNDWY